MSTAPASATISEEAAARPRSLNLARALLVPATMIVILAVALLLLMTPIWTHFALEATSGATNLCDPEVAYQLSDRTVSELFFGPGTFSDFGSGRGRAHARRSRRLLRLHGPRNCERRACSLWQLARHPREPRTWRSVSRGGILARGRPDRRSAFSPRSPSKPPSSSSTTSSFPAATGHFRRTACLIRLYPYAFWELSARRAGRAGHRRRTHRVGSRAPPR